MNLPIVVISTSIICVFKRIEVVATTHLAKIPQSKYLILAIRDDISSVSLGRDVRDPFSVTNKYSGWFS